MTQPTSTETAEQVSAEALAQARAAWIAAGNASAAAQARYRALCAAEERGHKPGDGDLHAADQARIATGEHEATAARQYLTLMQLAPQVTVTVDNAYECGRQSQVTSTVPVPPGTPDDDWWIEKVPHGDGHPCGSRDNALYEFEIVASADRPDLIGARFEWG